MSKTLSLAEVKKHTKSSSCWIIIHNDVYDVSKFLCEHPGGADSLLSVAGRNGTSSFEDVGHSDDAKEMMKQYKIGTLRSEDKFANVQSCCTTSSSLRTLSAKSSCSGVPKKVSIQDHKNRRPFDDPDLRSRSSRTSVRSTISEPRIERRVSAIVVPIGSNWWKYALLALAGALIVGFIIKKQQMKS